MDRLLTRPGRLVTVLSNSRDNGAEFLTKCAEVCQLNRTRYDTADLSHGIQFQNMRMELRIRAEGKVGRIKVLASNPRTARGFSGDLILDEFAFHEDADAIWEAAEPILASNPDFLCRIASTGNGRHNLFYRMVTSGLGGTASSSRDCGCNLPVLSGDSPESSLSSSSIPGRAIPQSGTASPDSSPTSDQPTTQPPATAAESPILNSSFLTFNTFPSSRLTRTEAHAMGVPIFDPITRQPITPAEARARALDKRAYDQNYECAFNDENLTLLSHDLINAAEHPDIGFICEQHWDQTVLFPSQYGVQSRTQDCQSSSSSSSSSIPDSSPTSDRLAAPNPATADEPGMGGTGDPPVLSGDSPERSPNQKSPDSPTILDLHALALAKGYLSEDDLPRDLVDPIPHPNIIPATQFHAGLWRANSPGSARLSSSSSIQFGMGSARASRAVSDASSETSLRMGGTGDSPVLSGDSPESSPNQKSVLGFLNDCSGDLFIGFDVARTQDLSVITVLEQIGPMKFVRAILRMSNLRLPEQQARLADLCRLPKFRRAAIDMTGLGLGLVEYAQQQFGSSKIVGINFATSVPATNAIHREGRHTPNVRVTEALAMELLQTYEDRRIQHPADPRLREDLRRPERITTPGGRVSIAAARDASGHADHFWSFALALEACATARSPGYIQVIPRRHRPIM